jgi:hypothetical protein
MVRISISLPDSLMAKLEPIKNGVNISQLCREALEQRIEAYERAAKLNGNDLDMDALVGRLRGERDLFGGKFEELGQRNAVAWLTSAPYLEIQTVATNNHSGAMGDCKLPRAAFNVMKQDMKGVKLSCEGPQTVVYKTAWLDYVNAVWTNVVERMEEPVAVAAQETRGSGD